MDWIKKSIMATKGVGKNASGKTHNLTEKVQGNYHYTMGPYSKPVMHIKPGDTDDTKLFTLQTASCLGNCGAAPMAIIGDDTHGTIDPEKTYDILGEYKKEDEVTQETEEVG